jgi:hypothetical protein
MPGSRTPGPTGTQPPSPRPLPTAPRPGPIGTEVRFPTLEVFAALHGDLFASDARPLTQRELDTARPIFGSSLAYEAVRIVVAPFANAPTTLGNFIRISPEIRRQGLPDSTLIHELTHIWQFQTRGMRYMSNSLCAQVTAIITEGDRNYAYDLTGTDVVRAGSIDRLPAEKQAMFVELTFMQGSLIFPGSPRAQRMRQHPICQSMLREVQAARPLLLGQIIEEAAFGPGSGRMIPGAPGTERDISPTVPLIRFDF